MENLIDSKALGEESAAERAVTKIEAERAVAHDKGKMTEAVLALSKVMKLGTGSQRALDALTAMRSSMIDEVSRMLTRFCYQNGEFAEEVLKCERDVGCAVDAILGKVSADKPALSDLEAYAAAVQFYIPSAQVTVSFRINIPCEIDDDLGELGVSDGGAMILDLFEVIGENVEEKDGNV